MKRDKRRLIIEAILSGASREDAAQAAGLTRRTVGRYLRDPGFAADLEAARVAAFADALGALKGGAALAVKTLLNHLGDRLPAERRQAAREILAFAFKGVETFDLEARIKRLEVMAEDPAWPRPPARLS